MMAVRRLCGSRMFPSNLVQLRSLGHKSRESSSSVVLYNEKRSLSQKTSPSSSSVVMSSEKRSLSHKAFPSSSSDRSTSVVMYSEKRLIGYSCDQMYQVVSDVGSYYQFIPYCRRSVVTLQKPGHLSANLMVGFQPFFNLAYTSHVTMISPHLVTAVCRDVKIFDHLHTVWKFNPTTDGDPAACEIDFAVSFAFISNSHSYVARLFLDSVVKDNVKAFIDRAETLFGPPSRAMNQKSVMVKKL